MKKILIAGLIGLATIGMVGCGSGAKSVESDTATKAVEQAELALANMEYDKALASFNLAIEKGNTDEKNKAIKTIIEQYLEAHKLLEEGKKKESSDILSKIDLAYKNLPIAGDIDKLKEQVTEDSKKENNEEAKEEKDEKAEKKKEESKPSNKDILAQKKADYLNLLADTQVKANNVDRTDESTVGMKESEGKVLELWDTKLNEIYKCLKTYLSSSEFEKVKQEQINWLKYRDETAAAAGKDFEGGTMQGLVELSSLWETTKERCYELVNSYM